MRVYAFVCACDQKLIKMIRNYKAVLPNFCIVLTCDDIYMCCLYMFNETAQQKYRQKVYVSILLMVNMAIGANRLGAQNLVEEDYKRKLQICNNPPPFGTFVTFCYSLCCCCVFNCISISISIYLYIYISLSIYLYILL